MLVKSQFLQRNLLCPLKLGDGSASTWARNGTGPPTWCSYWRYVAIFWVPCNLTGNVLRTPHHDADGAQEWECYKTGGFSRIVYFQTKELCPPTTNNHRLGLMIFRYHKFGASTCNGHLSNVYCDHTGCFILLPDHISKGNIFIFCFSHNPRKNPLVS